MRDRNWINRFESKDSETKSYRQEADKMECFSQRYKLIRTAVQRWKYKTTIIINMDPIRFWRMLLGGYSGRESIVEYLLIDLVGDVDCMTHDRIPPLHHVGARMSKSTRRKRFSDAISESESRNGPCVLWLRMHWQIWYGSLMWSEGVIRLVNTFFVNWWPRLP